MSIARTQAPYWVKIKKTYSDLAVASTSNIVPIFTLNPLYTVTMVSIVTETPFAGGLILNYFCAVGNGSINNYYSNINADVAVAGAGGNGGNFNQIQDISTSRTISLHVETDGVSLLDEATQGEVNVFLLISKLPS